MGQHDRVVVDVDDARLRGDLLRDLVHVARRGQPGPDVDELADADLADQEADHPPQDGALRAYRQMDLRVSGLDLVADLRSAAKLSLPPRR